MRGTYVKDIDCSIFSSSVEKSIATFKELQLASVIAVSKHNKERKEDIINGKKLNYLLK